MKGDRNGILEECFMLKIIYLHYNFDVMRIKIWLPFGVNTHQLKFILFSASYQEIMSLPLSFSFKILIQLHVRSHRVTKAHYFGYLVLWGQWHVPESIWLGRANTSGAVSVVSIYACLFWCAYEMNWKHDSGAKLLTSWQTRTTEIRKESDPCHGVSS